MSVFMPRLAGMREGTVQPAWVPATSGIRQTIGYVEEDEFIVVAARPGEGKSSILRYEAYNLASGGQPVALFNMENSQLAYARYALALAMGIDSNDLKNPENLSEEQVKAVRETAEVLSNLPLYVHTLGAPSVDEVLSIIRKRVADGVRWIAVDYLQLIRNPGVKNRVEDITLTSTQLRGAALNFKVPIVAAAQLNREIEHRGEDAQPRLSDLRGSGSLEQDATGVWFPRRLWPTPTERQLRLFPQNTKENGDLHPFVRAAPLRLFIRKTRNGPTGITEPVLWEKHTGRFIPLEMRTRSNDENL
jgi:replicative DNA helicase